MEKPAGTATDPGLRLTLQIVGAVLLWMVTFATANVILAGDPAGLTPRLGAVLLALVGLIPWVWMTARAIAAQDEFTRRIHFIALSWAFAATGVFVVIADLLVRARFLDYLPIMHIFFFMVVAWWLSMMLTARYFR
jgi:hypothetical protein